MSERPAPPPPPDEQAQFPKIKPKPACVFGKGSCNVDQCGNVGKKPGEFEKRRCVPAS